MFVIQQFLIFLSPSFSSKKKKKELADKDDKNSTILHE